MTEIIERIDQLVQQHPVVLFMKGTPMFPQCGFSSQVVAILQEQGVDFHAENVLLDEELRAGIKVYSQWPTIPQLYVRGEFIGGCDIVTSLYEKDQLAEVLGD